MQARGKSRGGRLLAATFIVAIIGPIGAQQTSLGVPSTMTAAPFRHQVDRRVTYVCPATSIPSNTAVWGANNEYTFDSAVCVAAVHAEVLPLEQAGVVTFVMGPGAATFGSSRRNGIQSESYGPYDSSFSFDRSSEPVRIDGITTWRVPAGFTTPVSVVCPRLGTFPHPLWGIDIYADDSSICAAAVHAGVIPNTGGPVTVTPSGARPSFQGSTRYGVTSLPYSAWPVSFTVAAIGATPIQPGPRGLTEGAPTSTLRNVAPAPAPAPAPVAVVTEIAPVTATGLLSAAPATTGAGGGGPGQSTSEPYYVVTIPGLIVQRATKELDFAPDGRGDEVIAAAVAMHWDRQSNEVRGRTLVQTVEYGDTGVTRKAPDRVQAGSRAGPGGTGGLQAGDTVPTGFAPGGPHGAARTDSFPLLVWQGTLTEGVDGLLVVPSVWERDAQRTSFTTYRAQWLDGDATRTVGVAETMELLPGITATESTVSPGLPMLLTLTDLMAHIIDRPMGLTPAPLIAPYNNRFVVITREKLAGLTAPGNSTEIFIDFAEPTTDPVLDGNYRLYLRVERVR